MRKPLICECGCFKFYIYWSTARCAHCGAKVVGTTPKNWIRSAPDVVPITFSRAEQA